MNDLLKLAIEAHGGLARWEQISRFRAAASITGAIWALKGQPGLPGNVVLDGETRDQRLTIAPFPRPGQYTTWQPDRQTIATADGVLVAERRDPAAWLGGLTRASFCDEFQVAYVAAEAGWKYFTAPFIFARPGFVAEETWPWREDGQVWRRLQVTCPDTIVARAREQTCYFDDTGLLRRLDDNVDILGSGPVVHYPSAYREFDGVMVPTRRRVYVRDPDGFRVLSTVLIAIDVTDVTFT